MSPVISHELTPLTNYVLPNEKAYALVELNLTPLALGMPVCSQPDVRGLRRYRLIWVNRNGKLALYREESTNPTSAPPVRIPLFFEHTVAEACGIADQHANIGCRWEEELAMEKQAQSTLHRDIVEQIERRELMRMNRSSFGPLVRVERNGYPQELRRRVRPRNG